MKYNDIFRPYPIFKTNHVAYLERIIKDKKDLEEGDIVTLRNGDRLIYAPDNFCDFADLSENNCNSLTDLTDLKDDLTFDGIDRDRNNDIVKVERPVSYYTAFEREDKAREMTVEEISKELGYEVKVVKEK